jgi:hypothetical protein
VPAADQGAGCPEAIAGSGARVNIKIIALL